PGIGEETPYRLKERPHQQRLQAIAKMPTAAKLTLCFIAACALLDSLSCRAAAAPHAGNVKRALLRSPPVDVPTRSVDESDVRPLRSYLRQVGLQGGWQDELLADGQSWRLRQLPHNDFSPAAGQADCQGQPGAAAGQHGAVGGRAAVQRTGQAAVGDPAQPGEAVGVQQHQLAGQRLASEVANAAAESEIGVVGVDAATKAAIVGARVGRGVVDGHGQQQVAGPA
uniref:Methyltranfer_dom domain-containing protein n=1 Tax=Macrostomum lignano TaxID=282301 RepID=A0A1I8I2C7_9PLAT